MRHCGEGVYGDRAVIWLTGSFLTTGPQWEPKGTRTDPIKKATLLPLSTRPPHGDHAHGGGQGRDGRVIDIMLFGIKDKI